MRTPLSMDDDVAARLQVLRKASGLPLKGIVNQALRAGLDRLQGPAKTRKKPFRQRTFQMEPILRDLDDIAGVLAASEDEAWR